MGRALNATAVSALAATQRPRRAADGAAVTAAAANMNGDRMTLIASASSLESVSVGAITAQVLDTDEQGCAAVVHVIDRPLA